MVKQKITAIILLISFFIYPLEIYANEYSFPDYSQEFLGVDKHETYNRKMFNFNLGLNKYFIRPVHIIWATVLPQYGMDRIFGISNNIEYPIRLVSSLLQRDFHNAGNETKRFFINTTIGLAGMFDPAKHILKVERSRDNMDKAFARCNIKPGAYFVAPVINFTTVRGLFGRLFDMALNPTTYIGTPILAIIKAGITINRTSYLQSIIKLLETNFSDPYNVTKIAFGIDNFIKKNNYDRVEVISQLRVPVTEENKTQVIPTQKSQKTKLSVSAKIVKDTKYQNGKKKGKNVKPNYEKVSIEPDIYLTGYMPQSPVVDSMRTSLFLLPDATKSIWNELSIWNCSFAKRLRTSSVKVFDNRQNYEFRYMLQKDKTAPLAIIFPSTGDGTKASHPTMFAKMFYDEGYSIVIMGNPFQRDFIRSMPESYKPGLPARDAAMMRFVVSKVIDKLQNRYNYQFENKVIFGTSLAALDVLFMAEQESADNTLGDIRVITICPPIDLMYSITLLDNYAGEWVDFHEELRQKVGMTSAKLVKLYQDQKDLDFTVNHLPFDEDEAKLFTSFIMHEKLANVVFELEHAPTNKKSNIYEKINKMGFSEYMDKYIISDADSVNHEIESGFSLAAISKYLETANNYKIYHTRNDYLITEIQLKQLRYLAKKNLVILDNGSHMGFLYREEFLKDLKKTMLDMKPSVL